MIIASANGQFKSGTLSIGGNVGIFNDKYTIDYDDNNYYDDSETSIFTFSVIPKFGYFVQDNFEIGSGIGYTSISEKYEENGDDETINANIFSFYPYAKYYVAVIEQAGFVFDMGMNLGFGGIPVYDVSLSSVEIGVKPGFYVKLTKNLYLNGTVGFFGYSGVTAKNTESDDKSKYSHFGLSVNQSSLNISALQYSMDSELPMLTSPAISLGINFYLSK